jgi:hypothetical protein
LEEETFYNGESARLVIQLMWRTKKELRMAAFLAWGKDWSAE